MGYCILGSTGLLGQALMKKCKQRNLPAVGVARSGADVSLDITQPKEVENFFNSHRFDVVINTVSIVNHQICDDNPAAAYLANSRPSAQLSYLAAKNNFKYVYISTDGYFYGDRDKKHDEQSPVILLNEYARTKFAGEKFTLSNPQSLVLRTNIVGFRKDINRPSFVEWALAALKHQEPITLFNDYFTSSLSVAQFSDALLDMIEKNAQGLYNLASREVFSKKKFIEELAIACQLSLAASTVGSVAQISPKRADSLGLDVSKAENLLGYALPTLQEVIEQLKTEFYEL